MPAPMTDTERRRLAYSSVEVRARAEWTRSYKTTTQRPEFIIFGNSKAVGDTKESLEAFLAENSIPAHVRITENVDDISASFYGVPKATPNDPIGSVALHEIPEPVHMPTHPMGVVMLSTMDLHLSDGDTSAVSSPLTVIKQLCLDSGVPMAAQHGGAQPEIYAELVGKPHIPTPSAN